MYDREFAKEVASEARMRGVSRVAAERGLMRKTVSAWANGKLPHARKGFRSGRIHRRKWIPDQNAREPVNKKEQRAYDQALEEIRALRAVLDALKVRDSMSTPQKIAFAKRVATSARISPSRIAKLMGVSRQLLSYHKRNPAVDRDAWLRPLVAEAFQACGKRGYRAVHATIKLDGTVVSEKRVRRVMFELGLVPIRKFRRGYSSYVGEISEAPANIPLKQDGTHNFVANSPGKLLISDITEFRLPSGSRVYLSPVVDCFDGMPISWSISCTPDTKLSNSSLAKALALLPEGSKPVVHTDRGHHYRRDSWISICEEMGAIRSMSRKGSSADNARMEGFFGTLKQEFFYSRQWNGVNVDEFIKLLDAWMHWFITGRIKESLGWLTYSEYRTGLGLASTLPLAV